MSISLNRVAGLFDEVPIGGKLLRNRIVMPPMVQLRPITEPAGIEWYRERAAGGVGLVIVEATAVNRFGTELTVESLSPLVQAIHDAGALASIQLFPVTFDFPRTEPLPSPSDFSKDDIAEIVSNYVMATEICAGAGFDGIEPHGAHGYPINLFFSPEQNTRSDAYGGSFENRCRFAMEIVKAVAPVCERADMILMYRHTPIGKGYGIDESVSLCRKLVDAGVGLLDISPSSGEGEAPCSRAEPFRELGVPVIGVNELDNLDRAAEVLAEQRADLLAVGRALIADPDWPNKLRSGRIDEIRLCDHCNEGCHGNLRRGEPIVCVNWGA